jgi:hypothetical protein
MDANLDKAYWIGLAVSVVLPVLVGLVTTRITRPGVKAVLLLALSGLNGFLVEAAAPGPDYDVQNAVILTLVAFGTGVLSHFGLWKPTGVSGKAQDSLVTASPSPVSGV